MTHSRYYKLLNEDGTINRIGVGVDGIEITKKEYDEILSEIQAKVEEEFLQNEATPLEV